MKKTNTSILFLVLVIFISLCFLYFGQDFPFRSQIIPSLVALFVLILSIIQTAFETVPGFKENEVVKVDLLNIEPVIMKQEKIIEEKERDEKNKIKTKKLLNILQWIFILILGIYLVGFLVTLPVFLFLFYLIECRYNWANALGVTVVFWLIIVLVFELFLHAELYRGIILTSTH